MANQTCKNCNHDIDSHIEADDNGLCIAGECSKDGCNCAKYEEER